MTEIQSYFLGTETNAAVIFPDKTFSSGLSTYVNPANTSQTCYELSAGNKLGAVAINRSFGHGVIIGEGPAYIGTNGGNSAVVGIGVHCVSDDAIENFILEFSTYFMIEQAKFLTADQSVVADEEQDIEGHSIVCPEILLDISASDFDANPTTSIRAIGEDSKFLIHPIKKVHKLTIRKPLITSSNEKDVWLKIAKAIVAGKPVGKTEPPYPILLSWDARIIQS